MLARTAAVFYGLLKFVSKVLFFIEARVVCSHVGAA
jgi:hypothetical protein